MNVPSGQLQYMTVVSSLRPPTCCASALPFRVRASPSPSRLNVSFHRRSGAGGVAFCQTIEYGRMTILRQMQQFP